MSDVIVEKVNNWKKIVKDSQRLTKTIKATGYIGYLHHLRAYIVRLVIKTLNAFLWYTNLFPAALLMKTI